MPEIIEVKKYCDFINKYTKNKYILDINILQGRYKKHKPFEGYYKIKKLLPLKLLKAESKGKFIYITFENDIILFCTLGLSGGWTYKNNTYLFPDLIEYIGNVEIKDYRDISLKHLNIEFTTNQGTLYYFDTLSFGTMKVANKELLDKKLKSIAPDIMDNMTIDTFTNIITKYPKKIIGLLLLNQKILSGIGNYLRADILWMSQVSPYRKVKNLSTKDIHNLYHNMLALTWGLYDYEKAIKMRIINKSIKIPSDYKRDFFVYYEDSDIYGNPVKKEELYEGSKKRFIYWCPKYQK